MRHFSMIDKMALTHCLQGSMPRGTEISMAKSSYESQGMLDNVPVTQKRESDACDYLKLAAEN